MIKIILVDDHGIMRSGIRSLLEKENDLHIIAETSTGREALKLLNSGETPDVILVSIDTTQADSKSPFIMGSIDLLKRLTQQFPAIKVIIFTMLDEKKYVAQAFNAGAIGYMLKTIDLAELLFGIRHVYVHGKRFISNDLSISLLNHQLDKSADFGVDVKTISISVRDVEIMALLSEGFTNQEIADTLYASKRTIESHRLGLIEKTGVRNTAALIRYAVSNNLLNN